MQETRTAEHKHSLALEDRAALVLDGVEDVLGFDEASISCQTALGLLFVEGEGLRILRFSAEEGHLHIAGRLSALFYEDKRERSGGLFSRLRGK